jgi:cystathionine beta-lyase/cystathionine gamma-synthase
MPDDKRPLRPPTEVLTRGFDPRLSVGSARPAVFRSSTYVFSSPEAAERAFDLASGRAKPAPGEQVDLIYSRFNHPNAEILEAQVVPIEAAATAALAFNTGMAAIMTAMLAFLRPGDSVIYTVPIYGGTQTLIDKFLTAWGVTGIPVAAGQGDALDDAIRTTANLKAVLIETPANPTVVMTSIHRAACTAAARDPKPVVMVDNTMLGPVFQHPLKLGADVVLYSATKYLSGFSDMLAGVALARDPELIRRMRLQRNLFGNILQPDECWMLAQRLPTVGLRMNRASKNGQRIAEKLAAHPKVQRVIYPSLFTDPEQIRIRDEQCDFPGAMFCLELKGGKKAAFEFLRRIRLVYSAVSLGGVETLICHPKTTTHSGFTEAQSAAYGITDGQVRVSVGIEDWRDLLADFEQALNSL